MEEITGRNCGSCGEFKLRDAFGYEKRAYGNMRRVCKACRAQSEKLRKKSDPEWVEKRRAYQAERYRRKSETEPSFVEYMKGRRATPKGRANQLIHHSKRRAEKKGWEFSISHGRVQTAIETGSCEVTGIPFDLQPNSQGHFNPYAPSLDRKDKEKGYTDENVQVVCWAYNVGKGEMTDDEYKAYILHVSNVLMGFK